MGRRTAALALLTACAATPPRPSLDASGALRSALPAEVRLVFEAARETGTLAISLRVAHSASRSLEGMKLVSCEGQIAVGEGAARRTFTLAPRLPGSFRLAWLTRGGSDQQPAYYEFAFDPVPVAIPAGPIDYELTAVIALDGRPVIVNGSGRALPGPWRGSAPPPEPGTAARY